MYTYIDLFCGIGGFHQAMDRVSKSREIETECLFAADIDECASNIYKLNYSIDSKFDLMKEETHKIIEDRIGDNELTFLFAGFPCQPFSKAGNQEGFKNKTKGTLFFEIEKIVEKHKPKFILLENVRNLEKHNKRDTWNTIRKNLHNKGYIVDHIIISPNEIPNKNIPALRDRIFILCYRNDLQLIDETYIFGGKKLQKKRTSIYKYNDYRHGLKTQYFDSDDPNIEPGRVKTIEMWNDLYHMLKENNKKIISPLWPHYFKVDLDELDEPEWKIKLIKKNVDFYKENHYIYDAWYKKHKNHFDSLVQSDKKFEWNAGNEIDDIWKGIIQFRPSGVRVKKPDFIPTLVAITQTPILGIEKRYMKPEEMAKVYGFKRIDFGNQLLKETYKQLGNTVSVDVVEFLINHMLNAVVNREDDYNVMLV